MAWQNGLDEDQHVYQYKISTGEVCHVYYANKTCDSCSLDVDNTQVSVGIKHGRAVHKGLQHGYEVALLGCKYVAKPIF